MRRNDKIREIENLVEVLTTLRAGNKKIVHCHGVFDLLHIGHIRHFEEAHKFGDILVVTITPDKFVNKGPHRPAFPESLRAEAIAALDCVDYVSINKWPKAVETIKILHPDFYVKGADYKDMSKDHTGGIVEEKEAIESVGGKLVFTEDISFSASSIINKHVPVFSRDVAEYLSQFSLRHPLSEILSYLQQASALKVLVVGEAIIDEYQYCTAIGKSSKEPTLAVKKLSSERFAGGALSIANHVAGFCDKVGLVTLLGTENTQEEFIREKLNEKVEAMFLYRKDSPTIVKRRMVESYYFTKLLEIYEINDAVLDNADNQALCHTLNEQIPNYDLVIVADFGHSMFSRQAVDILSNKARYLAVNTQSNAGNMGYNTISKYPRADYITLAEDEIRLESRDHQGGLREMVRNVSEKLGCKRVVVTRGSQGCLSYGENEGIFEIPAFAREVVDRVGAGDAFLSISALCAVQNAPVEVVGFIGNAAGAQSVATVCNRQSIGRVALIKQIEALLK